MLNPFLNPMPTEKRQRKTPATEESTAQIYGNSVDTASPRPAMGLWLGKLLIRMGEKLAAHETELKHTKEAA